MILMKILARFLLLAVLSIPCLSRAQAQLEINVDLPVVLPPLVTIEPGIRVVQDFDEEIFFVDGYYWYRRDGYWYRTHNHRDRWIYVERNHVPPGLVRTPPGHYKHWRKAEMKAEKRAAKEQRKRNKKRF